jgi:EpsI family protein
MRNRYLIVILLLIVAGLIGNFLRYSGRLPDRIADFSEVPIELAGYTGTELKLDSATYEVLKADLTTFRNYSEADGTRQELFLAYFKSQKYGGQIHSPKHCLPGGGWRIETINPFPIRLPGRQVSSINRLIISGPNFKSVMFYWYQTRSGFIRNEYGLKLDLVKNALLHRPTDAAIIRLTVDAPDGDIEKATAKGVRFLETFYPYIIKGLPF